MTVRVLNGDCRDVLKTLPDESVHCVVTSPPYWGMRDYGMAGQLGLEPSPEAYIEQLVSVFDQLRRVLRSDGTAWLNVQDGYSAGGFGGGGSWGAKPEWQSIVSRRGFKGAPDGWKRKELLGIPGLLSACLSASGWYLRAEIIWSKPVASEPPRIDRPGKSHEYVFLLSKSPTYWFNRHEDMNRTVWEIVPGGESAGHIAAMPPDLARRCILAGCPEGGTVLDPFGGGGTTGLVADRHGRNAILIELNPANSAMATNRITNDGPLFAEVEHA
jgi:DNA modification methylase